MKTKEEKDRIVAGIRQKFGYLLPHFNTRINRSCIHWALIAGNELSTMGVDVTFQAGTAMFPIVRPEDDDGVSPTHYSYVADHMEALRASLSGLMPEMHCWLGDRQTGDIIDLTVCYQTNNAFDVGLRPERPCELPDYIWGRPPEGFVYQPSAGPSMFAAASAIRIMEHIPGHLSCDCKLMKELDHVGHLMRKALVL